MRGGERVLERLLKLYPDADIFTHVCDREKLSAELREARIRTTFIAKLPFAQRFYQYYLPLMPLALEELDLTGYDLVISSESGPAKGVITSPDASHVCYCHSPMRYLWDHYHHYRSRASAPVRAVMSATYPRLRRWDLASSARVDRFVANSSFVQRRIRKVWRREADVIHPPVEVDLFAPSDDLADYYLWAGQMVPYKRPDLAVDAFTANGKPLLMVGTGSMLADLKRRAGPNVRFVDRLSFAELRKAYARARAFLMTAEEDFGITPVEAMASGRPVVAYGRGGVLDSVIDGQTGILFDRQDADTLVQAVEALERFLPEFDPAASVRRSRDFSPEIFDRKMREAVAAG
ncbi:glycosyltransferase [Qipengyuania oceanensis]|uniref:Glycosyltransferase n=1 Tax=Qipengyuania oceanensis TaxID=1463597 RepID=A0A844YGT1_9SPHN|nr:glycosyltransferase [Qipengyuania oceanensis]MXO62539.1 glycosyltransferase [Qipengyuania oceanensis]